MSKHFIEETIKKHSAEYAENTRDLSEDEFNDLFELEERVRLPFRLRILKEAHPLTPERIDFKFDRDLLVRTLIASLGNESIMLVGEKGTGKTTFVKQFHQRLGRPLFVINGGPGLDEDVLIGRTSPVETENGIGLKDMAGRLMYGLKWGIPVCIDEISTLDDRVLYACNDILSGERTVPLKHMVLDPDLDPKALANDNHGMVVRHPSFRFWATDNTGGRADADANFGNATVINAATRSRMTSIDVHFPRKEVEVEILKTSLMRHVLLRSLSQKDFTKNIRLMQLNQFVDFANYFRDAYSGRNSNNATSDTISMRELLRWAHKSVWYDNIDHGFNDAIVGNLTRSDRVVAELAFEEIFGRKLDLKQSVLTA